MYLSVIAYVCPRVWVGVQVESSVRVRWVQPRILDGAQIQSLRTRLGEWAAHVGETTEELKVNAPELFKP